MAVVVCSRCGDGEVEIVGEYVSVATHEDAQICGGSVDFMDRFIRELSRVSGVTAARVQFNLLESAAQVSAECGGMAAACYSDRDEAVSASDIPMSHELVHAFHASHRLTPDDYVGEGLATVYQDNLSGYDHDLGASVEDVLAHEDSAANVLPPVMYGRAAHFVRFLLDTYGEAAVLDLAARRSGGRPRSEQEAVFKDVFGDGLEHILAAYRAAPECSISEFRIPLVECSLAPTPWGPGSRWSTLTTLGCERDEVLGPARGAMWTFRSLDVAEPGLFRVSAIGAGLEGSQVVFASCLSSCAQPLYVELAPGQTATLALPEGRYYAQFLRHVDDPGELGLSVVLVEG